jgi:hypothetical protein
LKNYLIIYLGRKVYTEVANTEVSVILFAKNKGSGEKSTLI